MTFHDKYILNDAGEPEVCDDILTWGRWFEAATRNGSRIVKQDFAEGEEPSEGTSLKGAVGVSTVFLGLDHNFFGKGPPILWESLVTGTSLDGEQRRYASREDAIEGHAELLARVRVAYDLEKANHHTGGKPR